MKLMCWTQYNWRTVNENYTPILEINALNFCNSLIFNDGNL